MDFTERPGARDEPGLAGFLARSRDAILEDWTERVSELRSARPLPPPLLRDHVPELLDRLAAAAGSGEDAADVLGDLPDLHACARLGQGFGTGEMVREYGLLRRALMEALARDPAPGFGEAERALLHTALDLAVERAVAAQLGSRERLARAIDRMIGVDVHEAAADDPVGPLLEQLLEAMREAVPELDTAAILLAAGGRLHVRAAVGLEEQVRTGFSVAIGEGFAGRIAAEGRPLGLDDEAADDQGRREETGQPGLRSLYGVPLLHRGRLLGVTHVGSRRPRAFGEDDRLVLRLLAERASGLIVSAQVLEAERRALAEATLRDEFREQFLGVLGHDLRNPLATIRTAVGLLLRDSGLRPEQVRGLERIRRSADRMGAMIADVLDFVRGRLGGGFAVQRVPADLGTIAHEVVDGLASAHPDRELRFVADGDLSGRWDPDRLAQVVSNLVGNALQHGAAEAPVDARLQGKDGEVVFEVHNPGQPIPADLLPQLFEPFRGTAVAASRTGTGSLGLGLWIVREIVRAHGGTVDVDSSAGAGTTFRVRLPRVR